jgi:hypothetical protein
VCFFEECVRYYEDKKKFNGWEAEDKSMVLMDNAPSNVAAGLLFIETGASTCSVNLPPSSAHRLGTSPVLHAREDDPAGQRVTIKTLFALDSAAVRQVDREGHLPGHILQRGSAGCGARS